MLKKINDIGIRNDDLLASSITPQSFTLPRVPENKTNKQTNSMV
jgi:hypothetical protein